MRIPGNPGIALLATILAFGATASPMTAAEPAPDAGRTAGEVSDAYYDWRKTKQPERPFIHQYHQTLVYKIFLADRLPEEGTKVSLTFEQALAVIRRMDNLTLGMPKIVYLVGWQHDGHDSKYPDWSTVNPHLKRNGDATALDSLKWLMAEGFKHHTTVSLHVNMFDAYADSPLWETYLKHDIIAKTADGKPIKGEVQAQVKSAAATNRTQSYYISYAREWETGFARKRIDGLLAMLPIAKAGTIHIDAFHTLRPVPHAYPQPKYPDLPKTDKRISPFLDYSQDKETGAQRRIYRYFRDHGVDVTSEGNTFLRSDPFVGLQPMAWAYNTVSGVSPDLQCGTPMRSEPEILRDPVKLPGLIHGFCNRVVPWHYANNTTATKGDQPTRDGDDTCVPALWRGRCLVAYSGKGCAGKSWKLPPDWRGVARATLSNITLDGPQALTAIPVTDGTIALTLTLGQAVMIEPAAAGR